MTDEVVTTVWQLLMHDKLLMWPMRLITGRSTKATEEGVPSAS